MRCAAVFFALLHALLFCLLKLKQMPHEHSFNAHFHPVSPSFLLTSSHVTSRSSLTRPDKCNGKAVRRRRAIG